MWGPTKFNDQNHKIIKLNMTTNLYTDLKLNDGMIDLLTKIIILDVKNQFSENEVKYEIDEN